MDQAKEFFSLPFANLDLYFAELDCLVDERAWNDTLGQVAGHLAALRHQEKVIFHLEDTPLGRERIAAFVQAIAANQDRLQKMAFVGIHGLAKWRFIRQLRRRKLRDGLPWRILDDYQYSKEWIASAKIR